MEGKRQFFSTHHQQIRPVVLHWDVFVQHDGLLWKQTNKSYSKSVWVICAEPLLNLLDGIDAKPIS